MNRPSQTSNRYISELPGTIIVVPTSMTPPVEPILSLMKIEVITVGPYQVNCSIVWREGNQALVIDPGYDAPLIQSCLDANGLTVSAYLLTHGHADHISALADLHAVRPAPVYMHAGDERWAFGPSNQLPPYYPVPKKPDVEILHPEVSNVLKIEDLSFQTLETPGHTPGGVCYWFEEENLCVTGDTLFKGSCGRTDLPGGDARTLSASLKKLALLPPETRIIAGHGEETTIAHELKTNFFLRPR